MRPRKYPLQPLAELRQRQAKEAAGELAAAIRRLDAAARLVQAARLRRESQARLVAEVRKAELEALGRGDLRVRDLARADAWRFRAAAEQAALTAALDSAQVVETKACESQRDAQSSVASRHADVQVVEGHRARWSEERRRMQEASEEEAASEAWRPKR